MWTSKTAAGSDQSAPDTRMRARSRARLHARAAAAGGGKRGERLPAVGNRGGARNVCPWNAAASLASVCSLPCARLSGRRCSRRCTCCEKGYLEAARSLSRSERGRTSAMGGAATRPRNFREAPDSVQSMLELRMAYFYMYQKHGLFRFYIGPHPTVAVFKADYIETVLNGQSTIEKSVDYEVLHSWLGTGLLTSSGTKWKTRRRLLTPSFHFRILESFIQPMNMRARDTVEKLRQHCTEPWINIVPLVADCTLNILLETIMGVIPEEKEEFCRSYVAAVHYLSSQITFRVQSPWLLVDAIYFRTPYGKAYQKNTEIVHNFTARVIKERRKELERNNGAHTVDEEEPGSIYNRKRLLTFLDILLRYSIDNDGSISDEDIREEVDTFMFEGHDTTAVAICWTLYMLGLHQDHQRKVLEELDSVLGKGTEEDVTTEHMKELKYLDCVIKECQRLYPSVPIIGRESVEDFKLGDYVIPKGSTIDVFIYALHRDPEVFPDPERFDPSRFLPENVSKRHSHAFIPFSAGSRNCIGQRFAAMELKIVITTILRSFRVAALDQRDKMLLSSDLVLRAAGGIRLSFTPRVHGEF